MRNTLVSLALGLSLVLTLAGCNNKEEPATTPTAADACTHCPGQQVATADGKCPKCGMKIAAK